MFWSTNILTWCKLYYIKKKKNKTKKIHTKSKPQWCSEAKIKNTGSIKCNYILFSGIVNFQDRLRMQLFPNLLHIQTQIDPTVSKETAGEILDAAILTVPHE